MTKERIENIMESQKDIDWQIGKSLLQCSVHMFENKIAADVCFEVGLPEQEVVEILAHKYALISRSPVFETMFCGGLLESWSDYGHKIRVTDVEPEAFQESLRFIYCEKANITLSNVSSLLYTSKKYMLTQLSANCMTFLEENLNLENVCAILDQSLLYDETELTNKCLQFIGPNAQSIFSQESFLHLTSTAITRIAQNDYLYLDSETLLYNACVRWAKAQLQLKKQFLQEPTDDEVRNTLGSIIYRIRFPSMEAVEFAKVVGQRQVLSHEEKSALYYYILTRELPDDKCPLEFDKGMRVQICSRFPSIGSAQQWWSCNGPTDAISFQADCEIQIIGIALYGGKEKAKHDVSIEIRDSTGEISSEPMIKMAGVNLESDGSMTPCAIYLPLPVMMKADRLYTILVTMKGPLTHYGTSGRDKLSCTGVTFQFFSSNKSTNGTNVKSGQIPNIIFRRT